MRGLLSSRPSIAKLARARRRPGEYDRQSQDCCYADQVALPWIKQKTEAECGRAVLASVAARHSGDVETFYRRLPAPPDRRRGYSILQLQKFGARIGVNLSVIQPEDITIAGECSE